jgi:Tol biopolymer transport system component
VFRSHRDGGGIYTVSVFGGQERRLAGEAWRPRFSPDGTHIAYQGISRRTGGDLYVIASGGGQPRLVSTGPEVDKPQTPVWMPDGRHLLFAGTRGVERDWWVISPSGGTPVSTGLRAALERQRVSLSVAMEPAGWRGDRLVFALGRESTQNLWEAQFSPGSWRVTGSPRQITFGAALESHPQVSAAGDIVFTSEVRRTSLWLFPGLNTDGRSSDAPAELTRDASLIPGGPLYVPRFSASEGFLAYTSARSGNADVWLKRLSDGSESPVAASAFSEDQARLSRDASHVAYRIRTESRTGIQVTETGSRRTKEVCGACGPPEDWTIDGRGILYLSEQQHAVERVDLDTAETERVLHDPRVRLRHASLSPDGRWLAVATDGAGGFLARVDRNKAADRGAWQTISRDSSIESMHWSLDGRWLYFFSSRDDFRCLLAQHVDTATGKAIGEVSAIRHFHENRRTPWSTWIAPLPNGVIVNLTEALSNVFIARRER